MLFEIRSNTNRSSIFLALHSELEHFLNACIPAKRFGKQLFSEKLQHTIYNNEPTLDKFKKLWRVVKPLEVAERVNLVSEFKKGQFVQRYYEDKTYSFPECPNVVIQALSALTKHLFGRTSSLVGIQRACHETLHEHFNTFRSINSNVCCFCGASELAQVRAGVDVNDQWRAANDHLLAKDIYPMFAVHPDNLVPTCETCNSKAKLAKNILIEKQKGQPDVRRLCFYPFLEYCNDHVGVEVVDIDFVLTTLFTMNSADPNIAEKLDTWSDVYQIKQRVEGKFSDLVVLADTDCPARDINEFRHMLREKADSYRNHCRGEGWNFWRYRLYDWLSDHGNVIVERLWECILAKRSDLDAASVYGI